MKKPKLYTSRPPTVKSSPPSRQSRPSPPPSDQKSLSSHPWLTNESAQFSRMDQVQNLSQQLTKVTSQMEKWLNSFAHLSHATQDRKALNDLIAALSQKKNNSSSRSTGGSSGKSISDSPGSTVFVNNDNNDDKGSSAFPKPHSNDGDSLYDLINAPGMNKIVDHVMKNRQSRRGKKK